MGKKLKRRSVWYAALAGLLLLAGVRAGNAATSTA